VSGIDCARNSAHGAETLVTAEGLAPPREEREDLLRSLKRSGAFVADFRHPGNASYVGAAAGEDLALVTGRGQPDLTDIDNLRPYVRDKDVVLLGIRPSDDYRLDLKAAGITVRAVPQLRAEGAGRTAAWAREQLSDCLGFWVHVDVDVLDPAVMPAVDAPAAGGIAYTELELLIAGLVASPACVGLEVTVFDPDYDPDGVYARDVADTLVAGLAPVVHASGNTAETAAESPPRVILPSQRTGEATRPVEAG